MTGAEFAASQEIGPRRLPDDSAWVTGETQADDTREPFPRSLHRLPSNTAKLTMIYAFIPAPRVMHHSPTLAKTTHNIADV